MIERRVVLGSDEGAVAIRSWGDGQIRVTGQLDSNTLVSDPGVGDELWLLPADQWGPFEVTTRVLIDEPDDPGPEWEDVVEFTVSTDSKVVVTELVDNDPVADWLDVAGDWRVRVSAKGRKTRDAAHEELEAEEPIEWFLLEAWPASPAMLTEAQTIKRLTSGWAKAELAGPSPPLVISEGDEGLAAAQRIGRDVDQAPGARRLSGQLTDVEASRTIRGTRRRLFPLCSHLMSWTAWYEPSSTWGASSSQRAGDAESLGAEHWGYCVAGPDTLPGVNGAVRWSFTEVDKPRRAVRNWNWVQRVGRRGPSPAFKGRDVLSADSSLAVQLDEEKGQGEAWTTVRIQHSGVPVEWGTDLRAYWSLQLAIADQAGFGLPKS